MPREVKWFEEGYRVSLSCKQKAKIDSTFLGTLQFYLSIIENNTGSTEEEKGRKKWKVLELEYEKEVNERHPQKIYETSFFPNEQEYKSWSNYSKD